MKHTYPRWWHHASATADGSRVIPASHGPGFPPELVGKAFERFVRGDEARSRAAGDGGYGLGLSLVHAIVSAHGGTVSLRSTPGDTTVSVDMSAASG